MFELIVVIALVAIVYWLSLKLSPYVRCSRCKNNPKRKGLVFGYAHHICHKCKGTGQQVRFGYKLLGMGRDGQPPPP